jgi:glucokinase
VPVRNGRVEVKLYLGIDIGGTNVKVAVVGPTGKVWTRGILETDAGAGPRPAFDRIAKAAVTLAGFRKDAVLVAAGVGCAGLVDPVRGYLRASPNLPAWENSPLARIASRALGVYTIVDNDANGAAYGEFTAGACKGMSDLVFITLGTGVGGGVITGGRLLRGAANYAAELGHTAVSADGPRCRCGSRGCLEAYVGSYGLIRSARAVLKEKNAGLLADWVVREKRRLTPKLIFDAARRRDPAARAVVKLAGERLGVGVASLVNLFNPQAVVVGGGVAGSFDLLKPHVERTVRRRAFAESATMAAILPSELGNDATAVGAAMLARDGLGADG